MSNTTFIAGLASALLLGTACVSSLSPQRQMAAGNCGNLPRESCADLDFESGMFKGWNTKRVKDPRYSAVVVDSPRGRVVRFELRRGDYIHKNDGFRTELKENFHAIRNTTVRYRFSLMIPEDYPIGEDHRPCILGQWHDEPGDGISREPLFANYYLNGDFKVYVKTLMDPKKYDSKASYEKALHRANDPLDRGDVVGEIKNFKRGVWHDLSYEVKWSQDETGYLKAWDGEKQIVDYRGPMGNADEALGSYFKYGVYCKEDVTIPHVAFFGPYHRQTVVGK